MRFISTLSEARACLNALPRPHGLVPTMGYLHEGHLSLVKRAREENATATASIFVNPTQFGPREDLASYPRDLPRDLAMLERAGVDVVFTPSTDEMYPPGNETVVTVGSLSQRLEGAARPGHFDGVATVVAKLFSIMAPDRAYFGQKDAQQAVVIRRLVRDLRFAIEIVVCPTVREADGLALSSRNAYLSATERESALVLSRALFDTQSRYVAGERDARVLRAAMLSVIQAEPAAQVDYVSVAHPETLDEIDIVDGPALASLAVRIGRTRLIDNVMLQPAR
ncbi:MAG: pantoate--beta-alanine ligase [Chloroflexota bacterium]